MTWLIDGNSDIDETTNFLGTTTNQPLIVRTNHSANPAASERMRISASGNVGIGTTDLRYGRLTIEHDSVPLSLRETGQSPTEGGSWRMPLDEGMWRFDVNTAAAGDFSSFSTLLTMFHTGDVHLGGTESGGNLQVNGKIQSKNGGFVFPNGSVQTTAARRGSAGRTAPGQGWQEYGTGGIFIDVNTQSSEFDYTPVYVTSLCGDGRHWDTTGGSSVYFPSPSGFRVYVKWRDNRPMTVADAQNYGWHVNWMGFEATP